MDTLAGTLGQKLSESFSDEGVDDDDDVVVEGDDEDCE